MCRSLFVWRNPIPIENFVGVSTAGLEPNNPAGTDPGSDIDNHLRGVKNVLKFTFPNFTLNAQVDATQAHLNNPLLKTTLAADKVPYYTGTTTAGTLDLGATGKVILAAGNSATVISTLDLDNRFSRVGTTINQNITTTGVIGTAGLTITSTSPTITFADTDWGNRSLHNNGGLIGFLNNGGGWTFYSGNDGSTTTTGTAYAADFYISSDPALKKDIKPISKEVAESFVRAVKGYTYRMIEDDKLTSGVMSTEVKQMVPALVTTHDDGFERVNYNAIIPYLLVTLNAQIERNDLLGLEIRALRDELASIARDQTAPGGAA